jgi:hypothetical protein
MNLSGGDGGGYPFESIAEFGASLMQLLWRVGVDPKDLESKVLATARFQTLLDALRDFRAEAGKLREEQLAAWARGPFQTRPGASASVSGRYAATDDGELGR